MLARRLETEYGIRTVVAITPSEYSGYLYNLETSEHVYRVGEIGTLVHNSYVDVWHYTDRKGFVGINSSGKIKAGAPRSGRNNPEGAYFTTLSPDQVKNLGKLGLTNDKFQYFFKLRVPKDSLKSLPGGRGNYIKYSPDDVALPGGTVSGSIEDFLNAINQE